MPGTAWETGWAVPLPHHPHSSRPCCPPRQSSCYWQHARCSPGWPDGEKGGGKAGAAPPQEPGGMRDAPPGGAMRASPHTTGTGHATPPPAQSQSPAHGIGAAAGAHLLLLAPPPVTAPRPHQEESKCAFSTQKFHVIMHGHPHHNYCRLLSCLVQSNFIVMKQ